MTVNVRVAVHSQRRSVLLDGRRTDQVSRLDSTRRVLPAQRGRPALPTHRLHQHATPMTSARSFVMTSFKNSVYHPCCSAMSLTWKSFAELSGFKTKIPQVAISLVILKPSFFLVTSQKGLPWKCCSGCLSVYGGDFQTVAHFTIASTLLRKIFFFSMLCCNIIPVQIFRNDAIFSSNMLC